MVRDARKDITSQKFQILNLKVEKCPVLQVAVDAFFGAGPTGKVNTNKTKEARDKMEAI